MIRLTQAKKNIDLLFLSVEGGRGAAQRLSDMGLVPGEKLKVLNNPGFGPVTVLIKGVKVGLGHGLAFKILIKEE